MRRPALPPLPFAGALADPAPARTVRPLRDPLPGAGDDRRLRVLRLLAGGVVLLLFVQGLRLQVASGSLFRRAAEENRVRHLVEYAPRGI